jgi:LysM repeat protein
MNSFFAKIKQLFFTGAVRIIRFFGQSADYSFKFLKIISWPFFRLGKFFLHLLLLPLYQILRKVKRSVLILPVSFPEKISQVGWHYAPLGILVIIGLIVVASNLQAKETKPENYGQKSLLYKIVQSGEEVVINEDSQETTEGPLTNQALPTSYLKDEAITGEETGAGEEKEGINTLVSITGDQSALISPDIIDPDLIVTKRDKVVEYQIQPGDSLSVIAAKFNLKTTSIMWENDLSYYSVLKLGQILRILPVDGLSYKVKTNETLDKIAKKYQSSVSEIVEVNKLASAGDLKIGQLLILPNAVKPQTYVPPSSASASSYSLKTIFSSPARPSASKLQWPAKSYRITQYYRWRHGAIDIADKTGQPIYAAESGVVQTAGWNRGGYGNMVMIDHGGGMVTLYGHVSQIYVKAGDRVQRGQVIAAIGSTGRSTGPHLHFEVRVNNVRLNPLGYVR